MKRLLILFIMFLFGNALDAQTKESFGTGYYSAEYRKIMNKDERGWQFETDSASIKTIYALKLWERKELDFFLKNKEQYKQVQAISIHIRVDDFDFLTDLPYLEFVSVGGKNLNPKNIESLAENLNKAKNVYILSILNFKKKKIPSSLTSLKYLKAMRFSGSRIENFDFNLKLKNLVIEYNKSPIKSIRADQVEYVTLNFNELRQIPEGLNRSKCLKGLSISDYTKFKVNCPLEGFENLIYFDAVGAKELVVGRDCFENEKIRSIWGNVYEEYHLNEYKNEE